MFDPPVLMIMSIPGAPVFIVPKAHEFKLAVKVEHTTTISHPRPSCKKFHEEKGSVDA
jgi:hypothetical protein